MEILGRGDGDVDRVVWIPDLSVKALIGLVERLEQTTQLEQFIFREAEMDDAYRQADTDVRLAVREGLPTEFVDGLQRVRSLIFAAHDLVGLGKAQEAARELNTVIGIKIGLESS